MSSLRQIAEPFVAAAPAGARVRTRIAADDRDDLVLRALGVYLGMLMSGDLAARCAQRRLTGPGRARSRQQRKQELTGGASSRWAGAITRTSDDAWNLGERNLIAEARSLRARVRRIDQRLAVPVGEKQGPQHGYASQAERWAKQQRVGRLRARLAEVEARLQTGRVSVCRGGRRLARVRHNLDAAKLTEAQWRERWESERWFITADGETDALWGNQTIRWHPTERWVELKLPAPLAYLANRPHGRYRLSQPVQWPHRGDEVAAQAQSGAVRYDITHNAERGRWYIDASWRIAPGPPPTLGMLRERPVLAVDLNHDHLAAWAVTPDGNPVGPPVTIPLALAGLPASQRDGRVRAAISELIRLAAAHHCLAIVIENLNFADAREQGRENRGRRPARGKRGKNFRRLVAGIPTARFRDRLAQMTCNAGLAVIVVDPAYTSRWGREHWLTPLQNQTSPTAPRPQVHHAAAVVIGRRAHGYRARTRCAPREPEDSRGRATRPPHPRTGTPGFVSPHEAERQTRLGQKTVKAERIRPPIQAAQDRSGSPTEQDSLLLSA